MFEIVPLIFSIAACEALAQTCLKYYHSNKYLPIFLVALILYTLVAYLLYKSYDYKGVGIVNTLWSGMSILVMLTIGILVFKEQLHLHDWIGVGMIIIGMYIITLNK